MTYVVATMRSQLHASISSTYDQFVAFIYMERGAFGSPYEDSDSGSSISLSMEMESDKDTPTMSNIFPNLSQCKITWTQPLWISSNKTAAKLGRICFGNNTEMEHDMAKPDQNMARWFQRVTQTSISNWRLTNKKTEIILMPQSCLPQQQSQTNQR